MEALARAQIVRSLKELALTAILKSKIPFKGIPNDLFEFCLEGVICRCGNLQILENGKAVCLPCIVCYKCKSMTVTELKRIGNYEYAHTICLTCLIPSVVPV